MTTTPNTIEHAGSEPVSADLLVDYTSPDALFADAYLDVDHWRDEPRRRYLHGGFRGTDTRFSLHLPPAELWQDRFFHYITPVPDSEHFSDGSTGEEDKVSFSLESGAAFLETNGGGASAGDPRSGLDPSIGAYRANAAAARVARAIARAVYGRDRVYGYAFGGSGGGFRTIGGAENTAGVWDGFVPYVIGSSMAIPNCFTARIRAMRVVGERLDEVMDAVDAGGSGDPFTGLDQEQAAALLEVTRMGFPLRSWFGHRTMGMHGLAVLYPSIRALDPSYFEDFWQVPGYLGADGSPSLDRDRVQHHTAISGFLGLAELEAAGVDAGDHPGESSGAADDAWLGLGDTTTARLAVRLGEGLSRDLGPSELVVTSGAAAGSRLVLTTVTGDIAVFGPADPGVTTALAHGDEVTVDNSGFLAIETYHRHQVPGPDFPVWDQFRDAAGHPLYPQRPRLVGPILAAGAAGSVQSGRFAGKMIVLESGLDREAYPWQADWYRAKVHEHLGAATDDSFRLWLTDNALHGDFEQQERPEHTVSYLGILQQALRDLAAWVQHGVEPARSSSYSVVDGQVRVPQQASTRGGVQPTVVLHANGADRAEVTAGASVSLHAVIEAAPGSHVISVEWSVSGDGTYEPAPPSETDSSAAHREVEYAEPGTYFPVVRVTAHRDQAAETPFARLQNLARVRVVVEAD